MKKYGILLIGCGHIGMEHLTDIYYRDNIRIEAVVDSDADLAQKAAKRSGANNWGTDYLPFLKSGAVDIVIIATYTSSHLRILKDCIKYNKHVLCEKPIATNYDDGYEFVSAVKNTSVKVLVGHILRHNHTYQAIYDIIKSGAIGELRLIRVSQNHHAMDWKRYCRLMEDCSPTVDCGVHYYDLVQWITESPIIEVNGFGQKTQPDSPCENYTMVSFKTESGCGGFYESGWGQSIRSENVKEFIGTKGHIALQMEALRTSEKEEGDRLTIYHSDTGVYETRNIKSVYKDMYSQLEMLIDMIENNTGGVPDINSVWRAFCVALAADKSIKEGRHIFLDDFKG